jgi:hypothetical protein
LNLEKIASHAGQGFCAGLGTDNRSIENIDRLIVALHQQLK